MPYIKETSRTFVDDKIEKIIEVIETEGELCYCIYAILVRFCKKFKKDNLFCFNIIARCISAIECAKLEFYRRIVAPYEDIKIKENGDVE